MSTAAVRRAQTVSRVAMSPGTSIVQEEDSMYSVLNEAKEDLRKEKRAKVSFFSPLIHTIPQFYYDNLCKTIFCFYLNLRQGQMRLFVKSFLVWRIWDAPSNVFPSQTIEKYPIWWSFIATKLSIKQNWLSKQNFEVNIYHILLINSLHAECKNINILEALWNVFALKILDILTTTHSKNFIKRFIKPFENLFIAFVPIFTFCVTKIIDH